MGTHSVYIIGTSQAHFDVCDGPSEGTTLLTRTEKKRFADLLAARQIDEVPLYAEHGGGEKVTTGKAFTPPRERRIGRVVHGMVDRDGNLLNVCELQWDAPETKQILERMKQGKRFGLSLATDYMRYEAATGEKRVNHIGITEDPEYAAEGTWTYVAALSPGTLVDMMHDKFLNEQGMYVPEAMRAFYASTEPSKPAPPLAAAPAERKQPHRVQVGATRMADSASTTTPVAAVDLLVVRRELEQLNDRVIKQFANTPEKLSIDEYTQLKACSERLAELSATQGLTLADVPANHDEARPLLKKALERYATFFKSAIDQLYANESTTSRQIIETAVQEPSKYRPSLVGVMATANSEWLNQRKAEAALQADRKAKQDLEEARIKDQAMELETAKKRMRDLETENETYKRARTEVTTPAAVSNLLSPPLAAQGDGKMVAVGASHFGRDDAKLRDGMTAADAFLGGLGASRVGMKSAFSSAALNPADGGMDILRNFQALHDRLKVNPFSVFSDYKNSA